MPRPGAVVIGGYVNGLGLVRALAADGVAPAVVTTQPFDVAQRSRFCVADEAIADLEEHPERLVELLDRRRGDWAGALLLPTNDAALAVLAAERDRLSRDYRVAAASHDVIQALLDKRRLLEVAAAVGIDRPHAWGVATAATAARDDIVFPVVVKPVFGHLFAARVGAKLLVARNRAELEQAVAQIAAAGLEGDVFDLVPGPDRQLYAYATYLDRHGEEVAGVTVQKLRQSPPFFGVSRVAVIADAIAELRDATLAILRRIGFHGFAAAEFKLDPRDGRYRFLEINGRSVVYNGLLRRAGLDLARLTWSEAMQGAVARDPSDGWRGAWIHLHADIGHSLVDWRREHLGLRELLAPYAGAKTFAVWSASDPRPFLAQWGRTLRLGRWRDPG